MKRVGLRKGAGPHKGAGLCEWKRAGFVRGRNVFAIGLLPFYS